MNRCLSSASMAAIPMLLFLVVLAFILYGRWKEKRGGRATDD